VAVPRLAVILSKLGFGLVDPEPVAYMEAVVKNALTSNKDVSDVSPSIGLCASL